DPTEKDIYVEVDTQDSVTYDPAFGEIERAFEEQGIDVHFRVNETDLPGDSVSDTDSEDADYESSELYDEYFDSHGKGYHYLVLTPDAVHSSSEDAIGFGAYGSMVVQTDTRASVEASIMHELAHSLGLMPSEFDGIDSTEYSSYEYDSVMNYEVDDTVYSDGEPFDDWAWIKENMYTPSTSDLEDNQSAYTPQSKTTVRDNESRLSPA
ncbi:MAG: hypothetical protein ACOCQY_05170, partial [Halorhabdus sp.]